MQNSPIRTQYQEKIRSQRSPNSDKENMMSEVNQSQSNLQQGMELLNEIAETSKIDESVLDSNLTLFEKITHPKWQVRRLILVQLTEEYQKNQIVYEFQSAWLKNIINDTNQFAMIEGLKFLQSFVRSQQMNFHILPYFIGDLLEKGSFMKQQVQGMAIEILLSCSRSPQETGFVLAEILRKIESKHPKIMAFSLTYIERVLELQPQNLIKDQVREFIELAVSLVSNTNKIIRQKAINIFCKLYSMISETFDQVKKCYLDKKLRQIQIKELQQLCSRITKRNQQFEIQTALPPIQVIDLHNLLPDKFFEMPYYKHNEKKNITEQFARNLEKFDGEVDNSRDYGSIYAILITILEESNYLIYSQGMRCVKGLVKLLRKAIPQPVAKHFFMLILDKLKGSLSKALQSTVFNLLEDILIYENISCDNFIELMINQLEASKNQGLKISCARWFKDGWLALALAVQTGSYESSDSEVLKRFAQSNSEKISKSLLVLYKKVQTILKKENNLNYKRVLLDLFKSMQFDEQTMTVTVIESQIAIVNPQFDFQESRISENKSKVKNQSVKSRYQTDEDLCEFAQIGEEIQHHNKNRSSAEWSAGQLQRDQVEFMNKFSNDLVQLRKLSQNNQDQHLQNKMDEILTAFKNHYSDKDITGNDFLQQMTSSVIMEILHFCKKVQVSKKTIADKLYDFIVQLLIKMNKIQVTLDQELLYQEFKIALMQLNQVDCSKLVSLFESLYICNSLESMIKVGYRITNKYVQKQTNNNVKTFQTFINWLTQKIHAVPQQQIDSGFIRTSQKSFENLLKIAPQTQLDLRQLLNTLNSRIINTQVEQLDTYQDLLNQSQRRSKSKSFGSQQKFSPYETPNKTKSKLDFSDSEEKECLEQLTQIEAQINQHFSLAGLDKFIHYLNRYRAFQLCNQSQHTVFLSPNSRSPGKHWRRGIGRENMIISTPNRQQFECYKFEDFTRVLEVICQHYDNSIQNQIFQVFYLLKHIFPNNQQCLIYLIFAYICPKIEYSETFETFLTTFTMEKNTMAYQYRQAFNVLYSTTDSEQELVKLIHTGFNYLFQKVFENDLLCGIQYFITTLTFMLTQNVFYQLANDLLTKYQAVNKNFNQIIETELIKYKKLYDAFLTWQQTLTPQIDIQKLYKQNDILIVDLKEIEECASKREETLRENQGSYIHINKEDFELLESTTKNFNSQQTLRFTEENQQNNPDILNIQQFISPLQQISQVSNQMHDTVIQDLAKNLYSNDTVRLKELDLIKQQNESYRQSKRDSYKTVQESYPQAPPKDPVKQKIDQIYEDVKNESKSGDFFNEKSLLGDVLAPIETTLCNMKRNDCIKQMQELLLTSTSLYFDVASTLLSQYESLEIAEDKLAFVNDLKLSLVNQTLLMNINEQNFAVIIAIVLRLCTTPATQSEIYNSSLGYDDNSLTKSLQQILDVILHSKSVEQVLICLIRVFSDHLSMDFTNEISKNEKMMLRLNLKCIERLVQNSEQLQVFSILIEILKFFKCHPPENLIEGLPSIKELELYFKQMKCITDCLLANNLEQAKEFFEFVYRKNTKSIFLEYVRSVIERK